MSTNTCERERRVDEQHRHGDTEPAVSRLVSEHHRTLLGELLIDSMSLVIRDTSTPVLDRP